MKLPEELKRKRRKLPYKKMIQAIDRIVNNDWGADMVDMHINLREKGEELTFSPYTHEESVQMAKALGKIYQIAHCVDCVCYPKLEENEMQKL